MMKNVVFLIYLKFSKIFYDIYIDKIWKFNEKYICKWKVKKIQLR